MKIPLSTITVILESPDGDAKIVFERLKMPVFQRLQAEIAAADSDKKRGRIIANLRGEWFKGCVSVSDFNHPDGTPVTVEDVRAQAFYPSIVDEIFRRIQGGGQTEAEQKNAPSPAAPSAD